MVSFDLGKKNYLLLCNFMVATIELRKSALNDFTIMSKFIDTQHRRYEFRKH